METVKSLYEKLIMSSVRKQVFELLGTMRRRFFEEVSKDLTDGEKRELGKAIIDMIEVACKEFISEMRVRLEKM